MKRAGKVKVTPAEAVLMPDATVWLMLFSTIDFRPSTPRSTTKPRIAATVEPDRPKPSSSAM